MKVLRQALLGLVAAASIGTASAGEVVADIMRYDGHYVAVPVNVHRVNWLWANPEVLADAGVEMPTTWEELFSAAKKIRAAGYIPLAHGGQPWQGATIFETVVLSVGGSDLYRQALVELDPEALQSDTMIESLCARRLPAPLTPSPSIPTVSRCSASTTKALTSRAILFTPDSQLTPDSQQRLA